MPRTYKFSHVTHAPLQRNARLDTVNDLLATPFHVACVQEAEAYCVQPQMFDARAIHSVCSRDRSTMVNAGGTCFKTIRKTYSEEETICGWIRRTFNVDYPPLDIDYMSVLMEEQAELHRRYRSVARGRGPLT